MLWLLPLISHAVILVGADYGHKCPCSEFHVKAFRLCMSIQTIVKLRTGQVRSMHSNERKCMVEGSDYTMFALSWSSSTYSSRGISGMFHLRTTGCDGHVPVHGYCDTQRQQSRVRCFEAKRGNDRTRFYRYGERVIRCISDITMSRDKLVTSRCHVTVVETFLSR